MNMAVQRMVMTKLIQNTLPMVLNPLLFFFNSEAFFLSSEVRATAPISESLIPKNALWNRFAIVYHAAGK